MPLFGFSLTHKCGEAVSSVCIRSNQLHLLRPSSEGEKNALNHHCQLLHKQHNNQTQGRGFDPLIAANLAKEKDIGFEECQPLKTRFDAREFEKRYRFPAKNTEEK